MNMLERGWNHVDLRKALKPSDGSGIVILSEAKTSRISSSHQRQMTTRYDQRCFAPLNMTEYAVPPQ